MANEKTELWRSWQRERCESAFESLVRPLLPALFDAARRAGLRSADAEDVVQDALIELARESGERPGRVGIAPWLIRSVRLKSKMRLRSESRRSRREHAAARQDPGDEPPARDSVPGAVDRALADLSDADRQVLLLRFLYDLEYAEVAHVLGTTVGASRLRVHRALGRLRKRLGPQVGTLIAALPLAPVPNATVMLGAAIEAAGPVAVATAVGGLLVGTKGIAAAAVVAVGLLLGGWFLASEFGSDAHAPRSGEAAGGDGRSVEVAADSTDEAGRDAEHARLHGAPDAQEPGATAVDVARPSLPPHVVGRVRRPDGRAAAGAEVRVVALGLDAPSVLADDEGRYRIPVGPLGSPHPRVGLVVARDADGRAGRTPVYLSAGSRAELPARTLVVLGSTYDLDVVVRRGGEHVPAARVVLCAIQEHGWSGMEEAPTDELGHARFTGLPAGGYVVAASAGPNRATHAVAFPPDAGRTVALDLRSGTRTLEVTVLDGPTGEPIEGAQVELYELTHGYGVGWRYEPQPDIEPTDADGRVVVDGLDASARLYVTARAARHAPTDPPGLVHSGSTQSHPTPLVPGQTDVVLRLSRPVPVSWPIEDGEVRRPADGTAVVLRSDCGDHASGDMPAARITGGRLHTEVLSDAGFQAVAFLPDGAYARLHLDGRTTPPRTIRFFRRRQCIVTLRHPDGSPAVGYRAQVGEFAPVFGPSAADADGVVRFDGLPNRTLGLYLLPPASEAEAFANLFLVTPIHVRDADEGPTRLDFVVPRAREVLLRLRLDGQPLVPPDLSVSLGGLSLDWRRDGTQAGAVRFRVRPFEPGEPVHITGFATSFAGFTFEVPVGGEGSDPFEHTVDLQRAGEAWLRTVPPADGRVEIELQRLDPESSSWVGGGWPWWLEGDVGQVRRWAGLLEGTHRFVDLASGLATEPFVVPPGAPAPVVALDLSAVVLLEGRVEVPPGYDPTRTRLHLEGRPGSVRRRRDRSTGHGPRVGADGTFRVPVVPDRTETLTITHPELEPAPGSRSVQVSGRTAGVTLRLVERSIARFRLHPETRPVLTPNHLALPPRIRLYVGDSLTDPAYEEELVVGEGEARFGGFAPGTYTVWIDIPPFAPRVLTGVDLGARTTDLGEVRLDEGLAVHVRVKPRPGGAVGLLNLQARAVEGPETTRGILERTGHEITLTGLRPGKHRVQLFEGVQVLLDEIIEIEEPAGAVREVDLPGR